MALTISPTIQRNLLNGAIVLSFLCGAAGAFLYAEGWEQFLTCYVGIAAIGLFILTIIWDAVFGRIDNLNNAALLGLYIPWFMLIDPPLIWLAYGALVLVVGFLSARLIGLGGGAAKLLPLVFIWSNAMHVVPIVGAAVIGILLSWLVFGLIIRKRAIPLGPGLGAAGATAVTLQLMGSIG